MRPLRAGVCTLFRVLTETNMRAPERLGSLPFSN